MIKFLSLIVAVLLTVPQSAVAQNKVAVVPMGDDLVPITIPVEEVVPVPVPPTNSPYLDDALPKPIVYNQGWDKSIGHRTKIDPTVKISFTGIGTTPWCCNNAITYTPGPQIQHWGLQTNFPSSKAIYAKSVLLIDRGGLLQGGVFEWSLNRQNFVSLGNIQNPHGSQPWLHAWKAAQPRRGERVYFYLMSDDERFSSNPFTFIWP